MTGMRLKNTLILFVIAAVFVGYFVLFEQPRHKNKEKQERQMARLVQFYPSDVYYVGVKRSDVTLEFRRDGDYWWMLSPVADRAERAAVNVLINSVTGAEIERDLGVVKDLSPYGLDVPAAEITMADATGDTLAVLEVGDHTIDKAFVYALRPDRGSVLLVPTGIRRYAIPDPSEFRDKRVVDFQLADVSAFTVKSPGRSLSWRRTPGEEWVTERDGAVIKGNTTDVEAVLRRLRGLRAQAFVAPADAARLDLFEPATGSVTMNKSNAEAALTLIAGKRYGGGVCARVSGEDRVVVTDTSILTVFENTLYDLRERRLLRFDKADVTKIEFVAPDLQVTIVRPGRDWVFPNPSLGVIEQDGAARILARLANLEFESVVDENPGEKNTAFYLSKPDVRITIFDQGGSKIDELLCTRSQRENGIFYATSRSAGLVAAIGESYLNELAESFKNLRRK